MRSILGLCVISILAAWCLSGQTVLPPVMTPPAIVSSTPTGVIVRALVTPSAGGSVLPNGVNILQVDANGGSPKIIGTMNDTGIDGDTVAGDDFYGGTVTLNGPPAGTLYIRVSVAFAGSLRRTLSPIAQLLVTPVNVPNSPFQPNVLQTVQDPASGETVICNELLVRFQPSISPSDVIAAAVSDGGHILGMIPTLGIYQVGLPSCDAATLSSTRSTFQSDSRVLSVGFDGLSSVPQQVISNPNDYYFTHGDQWYLSVINMTAAWAVAQSKGIVVSRAIGIVDSGVNALHEDLLGTVLPVGINWCPSADSSGNCNVFPNNNTSDDYGHGTAVAGLAAAVSNNSVGVASPAFKAPIIAEKIDYLSGFPSKDYFGPVSMQAAAIFDAIANGARVINLSYGTTFLESTLSQIIQYAYDQDVVIVAAAGNYLNNTPLYPAAFSTTYPNVISVGATNQQNALAHWVNASGSLCNPSEPGSNYGSSVTIYAPGSGMLTLQYANNSGYAYGGALSPTCGGNGTSFAAPLVTGTVALMLQVNPSLTPAQVKAILQSTATQTQYQDPDGDPISILNAGNAIQQALSPPQTSPEVITSLTGPSFEFYPAESTPCASPPPGNAAALSFTLNRPFQSVEIAANIFAAPNYPPCGPTTGTVYLMNAIGPTSTVANVVATRDASTLPFFGTSTTLFSGLRLAPGTYYVVFVGLSGIVEVWASEQPVIFNSSDGTAGNDYFSFPRNGTFPPASSFTSVPPNILFTVSGIVSNGGVCSLGCY